MSSSARRSEAPLSLRAKTCRAALDRADEDICPYVIRGCVVPRLVTRRRLALSISLASRTIDVRVFAVWGRAVLCRFVFGVWLAVAGCLTAAWAKDMALVSNKSNGVTEVSMVELVKICKGQTSRWPKGKPITFLASIRRRPR